MPERIQLKRTKGWRMPPNTVKVDRSTDYGNPFKVYKKDGMWVVETGYKEREFFTNRITALQESMARFRSHLIFGRQEFDVTDLAGKNLACWCKPGEPCHADILLEFANKTAPNKHLHRTAQASVLSE